MNISYGDLSSSRLREVTPADIKVVAISSPVESSEQAHPIYVNYTLDSDAGIEAKAIYVEYSTDGGDSWSAATALASDPLHDGIADLPVSPTQTGYVYVWDSATDLTTVFQGTEVRLRISARDQNLNWSDPTSTPNFTVDMLPLPPELVSPADNYFDSDTTPDFIWLVPEDPGADRMVFEIEIDDNPDFSSPTLQHNSYDNRGRFAHKITASPGTKQAANGQLYYVKGLEVTSHAQAMTYDGLLNFHNDAAIPATLTNPQILLLNRADRRCYIDPSTITTTGFTISKSKMGIDDDGLVDLVIFAGTAGSFDTFWVTLSGVSGTTAYTYGSGSFATDLLGNTIPASIANCRPLVLEGNDRAVYLSAISDTGFTLNLSEFGIDATATVRICLRATPNEAYIHTAETISDLGGAPLDYENDLTDATNAGAALPNYIPGAIGYLGQLSDRYVFAQQIDPDTITLARSSYGQPSVNGSVDIHVHSEADANLPYWTEVPLLGVLDEYEGAQARYRPKSAEELPEGLYYWRVKAGNIP